MGTTYKIQKGDNLSSIAKKYGTTVSALQSANNISNPNLIIAGNTLTIPSISADNNKIKDEYIAGIESNTFSPSAETNTALSNKNKFENDVANYSDFTFTGQEKLNDYMAQWETRPDFNYDFNADALYQQYKDKYIQQGKMAMQDAIGQASAMTGGYGNSYAATVGNQAYQSHLQQLNDVIPELYQIAYDKYNQEGQDLLNSISMLRGEREYEYGVDQDKYNNLLNQQSYWGDQYLGLYDRDYGIHRDSVADSQWEKDYDLSERKLAMDEEAWELEKEAYNSLVTPQKEDEDNKDDKPKKEDEPTLTYQDIYKELNTFIKNGASKSEIGAYLREAYTAGIITQEELNELHATFVPRGSTY